jgi:Methyltransferase domain
MARIRVTRPIREATNSKREENSTMADLLIHSVSEFSDLILTALGVTGARNIVEIGAEYGGMSALLAQHCRSRGGQLTTIDPAPKHEFDSWLDANPDVRHLKKTSLEAFDDIDEADAFVVDGDHNWYTVYHELRQIEAISRRAGKPVLAFLHDVGWPCGRRDCYYAPELIPAQFRHPHSFEQAPFRIISRWSRGAASAAWASSPSQTIAAAGATA